MSEIKINLIDRHVSRGFFVSGFALFGLLLGVLTYALSYPIDNRFLIALNYPGIFSDMSIRVALNDYGMVPFDVYTLIIPASIASWAAIGFLLHLALRFFTTKTELVS